VLLTVTPQCFFIIRIRLDDPSTCAFLEVNSYPIKSCSKLEQIRRKEEEMKGKKVKMPKKKRARGEDILSMLDGIRQEQVEQAQLLRTLVSYQNLLPPLSVNFSEPGGAKIAPNIEASINGNQNSQMNQSLSLEKAMEEFLQVYRDLPVEERPFKLQCLRYGLDPAKQGILQEIGAIIGHPLIPPQLPTPLFIMPNPATENSAIQISISDYPSVIYNTPNQESPKVTVPDDDSIFSAVLEQAEEGNDCYIKEESLPIEKPDVDFSFFRIF